MSRLIYVDPLNLDRMPARALSPSSELEHLISRIELGVALFVASQSLTKAQYRSLLAKVLLNASDREVAEELSKRQISITQQAVNKSLHAAFKQLERPWEVSLVVSSDIIDRHYGLLKVVRSSAFRIALFPELTRL